MLNKPKLKNILKAPTNGRGFFAITISTFYPMFHLPFDFAVSEKKIKATHQVTTDREDEQEVSVDKTYPSSVDQKASWLNPELSLEIVMRT